MANNQNSDQEIVANTKCRFVSINSEEGQELLSREFGVSKERVDQSRKRITSG